MLQLSKAEKAEMTKAAQKAKTMRIAVLVPCKDEEVTIAKVIRDFKKALPSATVYVYDNNSTDETAVAAKKAGAVVGYETRPGKGNVIRRMFAEIDADIYLMVDGDDTYDAASAPLLVNKLISDRADMVVGARIGADTDHQRKGHATGNRLFNVLYTTLFGREFSDIFSG